MDNLSAKSELLQIIESVASEKGIPKFDLIDAMEEAVQVAARKKYGFENIIKVEINQNTGKISLFRVREVVQSVEDVFQHISYDEAILLDPDVKIGQEILEPLPPIDLGRVAAQTAKEVIVRKVGEIDRSRQYEDYKDRKGDILNGVVKRIEFGNIIVDVGRAEAILHRNEQIRGEIFKTGDKIKSYVKDVRKESKGSQIFLSRTDDKFLEKLFETEVPEIYDHIVEIKAIAREPGSKAKVAVFAADTSIDAVGSCVGVRGSRVKSITTELGGEKIDLVSWDKNLAQFIINSMSPAEISKIVFDEKSNRVEAIVPDDQLNIAIGRRGQNVRLASKITGWRIDVMTEDQESKRNNEKFMNVTQLFVNSLDVEEVVAQLLLAEGYSSVEQIAYAEESSLLSIEGFSKELVEELKTRAIKYVDQQNEKIIENLEKLGMQQELLDMLDLPPEYILKLAEFGVKTVEDLAEVTTEEFTSVVPNNLMSLEDVNSLINFAKDQENKK